MKVTQGEFNPQPTVHMVAALEIERVHEAIWADDERTDDETGKMPSRGRSGWVRSATIESRRSCLKGNKKKLMRCTGPRRRLK